MANAQPSVFLSDGVQYEISSFSENTCRPTREDRRLLVMKQRSAAREATNRLLSSLGLPNAEVARNEDRSPRWPGGIVGSIAHSESWIFVAVARTEDVKGLGVDVETIMTSRMHDEIGGVYLNANELALIGAEAELERASTVCFSAKEAFFKCVYPLARVFFDFKDAEISSLDCETGQLSIRLLKHLSPEFRAGLLFTGSFRFDGCSVFTAFELPPTGHSFAAAE